jgi:NitT/TauT family transport system substrate-binding protein
MEDGMRGIRGLLVAGALAFLAAVPEAAAQTKVRLAVGGQVALYYLPLNVAVGLGHFKSEGLDVAISDFAGGARALQALMGGSADVVAGAYDHTIQMQAKDQPLVAVVQLGRIPGFVLALRTSKAGAYRGPADLKGLKIGITAPGSSTHFMVQYMMVRAGLKADDASFIGVGAGASAVAAIQRGEIDALVSVDPAINLLMAEKAIKIVADTRTLQGTIDVYGGPYPAAVLYATPAYIQSNPKTIQSLVNAFVRTLKWIQSHPAEDIAKVLPQEHALGNPGNFIRSIRASIPMYSPDGLFTREGADTAYNVLRQFDPAVKSATIDVAKSYTDEFVRKAQ